MRAGGTQVVRWKKCKVFLRGPASSLPRRIPCLAAKIIKPPALYAQGDKIGLLAPASSSARRLSSGCNRLRQMGYEPVYSQTIFDRDIYFAGTVERRTQELEDFCGARHRGADLRARRLRQQLPAGEASISSCLPDIQRSFWDAVTSRLC